MLIMKVQVADSKYRFAWRMARATGSFPKVEKQNQPTHTLLSHYYHTNATALIKLLHTVDI